jgi:hypothetical protein
LSSQLVSKNLKIKIYDTIILPAALYGCETWSLTLRKEYRLRVFENRVLTRIFRTKREEVVGRWRRLHKEELLILYVTANIIRMIKSKRMTRVEHVACMGKMRNAYKILVTKHEGKRPHGRP